MTPQSQAKAQAILEASVLFAQDRLDAAAALGLNNRVAVILSPGTQLGRDWLHTLSPAVLAGLNGQLVLVQTAEEIVARYPENPVAIAGMLAAGRGARGTLLIPLDGDFTVLPFGAKAPLAPLAPASPPPPPAPSSTPAPLVSAGHGAPPLYFPPGCRAAASAPAPDDAAQAPAPAGEAPATA